jgi:nucleotide-binding universal stress UspA family protein
MKFQHIFVPMDDSDPAFAALEQAIALARGSQAELVIATVVEPALILSRSETYAYDPTSLLDALRDAGEARLRWALANATENEVDCRTLLLEGDPVEEIVTAAVSNGCDLILMGRHSRRGPARLFIGSTTEAVVHRAGVPVLVIHA